MKPFMILYRPGPAWVAGQSIYEQDLAGHGQHLQGLLEAGRVLLGGPFTDSTGGFAICLAASLPEAEAHVRTDPAVRDGVFLADVHALHLVFNKYVGKGLTDAGPGI